MTLQELVLCAGHNCCGREVRKLSGLPGRLCGLLPTGSLHECMYGALQQLLLSVRRG